MRTPGTHELFTRTNTLSDMATKKATRPQIVDRDMALDLEDWVMNDAKLYKELTTTYLNNLKKKKERGTYDAKKAPKLLVYLVDRALPAYKKAYHSPSLRVNAATKEEAAKYLLRYLLEEFKLKNVRKKAPAKKKATARKTTTRKKK